MNDIGNIDHLSKIVDSVDFPEELIISYYPEKFEAFIRENASKRSVKNVYFG